MTIRFLFLIAIILTGAIAQENKKYVFLDDTVVIEPGQIKYFSFQSVKRNGVLVTGAFRASGGARNDVEVYIFDPIGFENYMNGNQAETYYNSGRVTVGKIDVFLPRNKYFLVFSNKFSITSNKVVKAHIELD